MSSALHVGPLVLPGALLVLAAAAVVATWVGRRLGGEGRGDVESLLWWSLLAGLLTARAAYVWEFRAAYFASPRDVIDALDIRDGGWNPTVGLVGAWLFVLSRRAAPMEVQKPLRWALAVGSGLWVAGSMALAIQSGSERRLPALSLATPHGTAVRLDAFVGRPTVVNLWATWCGPCVREMPVLLQAQREHPDVHFVFINQGEPPERVSAWLTSRGLPLRNVLIDGKGLAGSEFEQRALPTTLFFDAQGRWVTTRIGELSRASLSEKLSIAQRKTPP